MRNKSVRAFSGFLIIGVLFLWTSCKKNFLEPSIEGTWIEIDNTTNKNPTGCELIIDKGSGDVSLCGFKFVHPYNVVTVTTNTRSNLIIADGQMYYKQKVAGFLWLFPVAKQELYFLDYDFDGEFLWIIGDDSHAKVTAKGAGKVFKRR
jgi:hypothetical protein